MARFASDPYKKPRRDKKDKRGIATAIVAIALIEKSKRRLDQNITSKNHRRT